MSYRQYKVIDMHTEYNQDIWYLRIKDGQIQATTNRKKAKRFYSKEEWKKTIEDIKSWINIHGKTGLIRTYPEDPEVRNP